MVVVLRMSIDFSGMVLWPLACFHLFQWIIIIFSEHSYKKALYSRIEEMGHHAKFGAFFTKWIMLNKEINLQFPYVLNGVNNKTNLPASELS